MATLPRYQQRGIQFASLPDISVAPQQAAISGASSLDQAISRMTSYFEQQAVTEAKTAAYKYAAENPLTEEQVRGQLAAKGKVTVDGAGRIFQQTYEQVQAKLLGNQILLEQEAEIGEVAGQIEAGKPVDLNSIQKDLKARRDGIAALLMQIDPETAVSVSSGLAKAGNTLIKIAAKKQAETQMAIARTKLGEVVNSAIPLLEKELEEQVGIVLPQTEAQKARGEQPRPFGGMELIIERGNRVEQLATAAGVPQAYEDYMKQARVAMQNVVVRRLTVKGGAADAAEALALLDANNLGNLSNMYKTELSQEEKDAVRVNVLKYFADEHTAQERRRVELERQQKQQAAVIWDEYHRGDAGPSETANRLMAINQATPADLKNLRAPDAAMRPAPVVVYDRILTAAQTNQIGLGNIEALYENGTIDSKQRNDLRKEVMEQGTEMSAAKQFISGQLGIPEGLDIGGSYNEQRRLASQAKASLISQQDEAMRKGLPFDPMAVARSLVAEVKKTPEMSDIDAAKARLREAFKDKVEYKENYTREDLERSGKFRPSELDAIMADLKKSGGTDR